MRSTWCFWALLACSLPLSTTAMGQGTEPDSTTAETDGARALFTQGIEAAAAGDYQTAANRFRAAESLRPAPAIELNLATALVALGALDEAEELVQAVLANPESTDAVREQATALGDRVRAEGGTLTIALTGDATDVVIRRDDRPLPAGRTRSPITTAAGAHAVDATREGDVVAHGEAAVERGAASTVTLTIPPVAVELETTETTDATAPETPGAESSDDWILWTAVGGGAVLLAVAVVLIVVAASGTEEPIAGTFQPGVLTW